MAVNCSRCGHKRVSHRDVNPNAACPCRGYRTPEQQEAWMELRGTLEQTRRCSWTPYSVDRIEEAMASLLELYP
jgi:hypothetical protein